MSKVSMFNISPIDGRYVHDTKELSFIFSEYAFIKQRVKIEIQYFLFLLKLNTRAFPNNDNVTTFMRKLLMNINLQHINSIKKN